MKKKFSLLLVLSFIFMTIFTSGVYAASKKAVNDPRINCVPNGTTMNSDYSFSLKKTDSTSIEYWGYSGKQVTFKKGTMTFNMILPQDDSLSGNIGCWLYNVGTHDGKSVDVKCTFYWNPISINGTKIHPNIIVCEKGDLIGYGFSTQSYEVKFELFTKNADGTRNTLSTNMAISLGDIDYAQYFGLKTSAEINSIICQNNSIVSYDYIDGYHWAYEEQQAGSSDGLEAVLRYELNNVHEFNIVYGLNYDARSYPIKLSASSDEVMLDNMEKYSELLNNESYKNGQVYDLPESIPTPGWGYFNSVGFGPYDVPTPEKNVNKTKVRSDEDIVYTILHRVPDTSNYESYVFKDTLADCLAIDSADKVVILDDSDNDVTSKFDVSVEGKVITASLKNLKDPLFYNNEYRFILTVHKDPNCKDMEKYEQVDGAYRVPNTADVVVNGDVYTTNTRYVDIEQTHNITTEVKGEGGTISGQNSNPYEVVVHGNDSTLPIVVTPDSTHQIKSIEVNNTPIDFEYTVDGTYTLEQFKSVTKDMHVVVTFEPRQNIVITKYLDELTDGELAKTVVQRYNEGDTYTTEKKEIENYNFSKDTNNTIGTMGTEDIEVIYYYRQVSGGLIVKYVDEITNQELDRKEYTGSVKDLVTLEELTFDGYELSRRPEETQVELKVKPEERTFYYKKIVDLKIKGVDKDTGEELYTDSQTGLEGESYTTEPQDVPGYDLVKEEMPDNKDGVYSRDSEEVVYKYKKKAGEVKVRYLDKDTNEVLDEYKVEGYYGDSYTTDKKDFDDYNFVEVVGEEQGKLDKSEKEVVYYYEKKRGKVIVTYEDTEGNVLLEEELEGKVKEEYKIVEQQIEDYDIIERPDSTEGEYEDGVVYKKYVLEKKKGDVVVNFKDTEGNEMYPSIVSEDYVGNIFDYEAPDKDGYKIVENKVIKVTYKDGEIVIDVIYEKLPDTSDMQVLAITLMLLVSLFGISFISYRKRVNNI